MLEIANLSVCYGALPVLHEVNLTVDQGELVALLGSNGVGKTTLLNVISRVAGDITSGNIIFEGSHIENLPPYRITGLGIAHVPEGRKLFPYLTVKENLLMGAYAGEAWRTKDVEIERVFGLFPILKERSHMPARSLSGGEQQMVAVARGLVSRPKLLMVDEPSLGLAPKVLAELYRVLATLHSEQGYSILLSEQNAHYALKIASRAYVLQDGRIVLEGRSTELLESELVRKAYLGK